MVRAIAAALAALLLSGCAADASRRLAMDPDPRAREIFFPGPPEVPRYFYAGQLIGEVNYPADATQARSRARAFLEWVAGLASGGAAPEGLQRPQAGAVGPDGGVYVTDGSRQAVVVFDPVGGMRTLELAMGLRRFQTPTGIAVTPEGRLLVADADLGFVAVLDAEGKTYPPIGRGQFKRPVGIAYDPQGRRVYVADAHAHDIKVFTLDGALAATLGRRGEGEGEFNFPTHLAIARGELYVADTMNSRVQVLDLEGRHRRTIGARGLYVGNLVRPKGVSVDGEGNVYVVESYYDHLLVYDRAGQFLLPIGGLGKDAGQFYLPSGVWTDNNNRIFVADMFNGRVVVLQFLGGDNGR